MKYIIIILFLNFTFDLFSQSNSRYENKKIRTVFAGVLDKVDREYWYIQGIDPSKFTDRTTSSRVILDSIRLNSKEFKFEFEIDHPIFILGGGVSDNGEVPWSGILIEPGDSIFMDLRHPDAYQASKVIYSGKGVDKLWCIQAIFRNFMLFESPAKIYGQDRNFNRISLSDSITSMIIKTIDIYKHKLSPLAITLIKTQYIPAFSYDISEIILLTGVDIRMNSVKSIYKNKLTISKSFLDYSSPYLIYCPQLPDLVIKRSLLSYAMNIGLSFNDVAHCSTFRKECFYAIKNALPPGKFRVKTLAWYIEDRLTKVPLDEEFSKVINEFLRDTDSTSSFHKGIQYLFSVYRYKLRKGSDAYNFSLPDTTGKIYTLNDFRGKAILIDFTFTGCIACSQMVPYLKKVEEKFSGSDDIIFLTISIDAPFDWRSGAVSSVPGNLFLYTSSWQHPIIKYYNVTGYPTLILIDRNSKIVSARAPNPRIDSGEGLISLINETINNAN